MSIPAVTAKTTPISGNGDISGVYTEPTNGGFTLAVDVHHNRTNDPLSFSELRLLVGGTGSWRTLKNLGTSGMASAGPYGSRQTVQIQYSDLNTLLRSAGITNITLARGYSGAQLGVYMKFMGHDQGVGGGGGNFGNFGFTCP